MDSLQLGSLRGQLRVNSLRSPARIRNHDSSRHALYPLQLEGRTYKCGNAFVRSRPRTPILTAGTDLQHTCCRHTRHLVGMRLGSCPVASQLFTLSPYVCSFSHRTVCTTQKPSSAHPSRHLGSVWARTRWCFGNVASGEGRGDGKSGGFTWWSVWSPEWSLEEKKGFQKHGYHVPNTNGGFTPIRSIVLCCFAMDCFDPQTYQ